ncbi:MAG: hypothetical protein J2P51_15080, partial [Hyphomicrobiaceae bacterium]|nr:hypothetical protein [Hyphomicrobiaceae bacterium]
MSAQDFSQKQHRDLEVFVSGVQTRRASQGLKRLGADLGPPTGPDRAHLAAMVHVEALGKELRKFNVGCDGGGATPVLEDANDIAFTALRAGDVE